MAAYANDVIGYIFLSPLRVKKEGGYEGGDAFHGSTLAEHRWPTISSARPSSRAQGPPSREEGERQVG